MKQLTGGEIAQLLSGVIYAKKQLGEFSFDLTVKKVCVLEGGGSLDFGGSEFEEAKSSPVPSSKRSAEDKYSWWELSTGLFEVHFNEKMNLPIGHRATISPHPRLLKAGGSHCTAHFFTGEPLRALLSVSSAGLSLKENCRVSRLEVMEL